MPSFFPYFFICFITSASAETKDESINFFRNIFHQTHEKNLTRVKLENDELTDEVPGGGVSITGYFKGEALLKISLWTGLSYGIQETEYYFYNDSLIFVYFTEKHFRQVLTRSIIRKLIRNLKAGIIIKTIS